MLHATDLDRIEEHHHSSRASFDRDTCKNVQEDENSAQASKQQKEANVEQDQCDKIITASCSVNQSSIASQQEKQTLEFDADQIKEVIIEQSVTQAQYNTCQSPPNQELTGRNQQLIQFTDSLNDYNTVAQPEKRSNIFQQTQCLTIGCKTLSQKSPQMLSNHHSSEGEVIESEVVHQMTQHPSKAELVEQNINFRIQQTDQQRLDFSEMEIETIINDEQHISARRKAATAGNVKQIEKGRGSVAAQTSNKLDQELIHKQIQMNYAQNKYLARNHPLGTPQTQQKLFSSLASSIKNKKGQTTGNQQLDDTEVLLNSIHNEMALRDFDQEDLAMTSCLNSEKDILNRGAVTADRGVVAADKNRHKQNMSQSFVLKTAQERSQSQGQGHNQENQDAATFRQSDGVHQSFQNCFDIKAEERQNFNSAVFEINNAHQQLSFQPKERDQMETDESLSENVSAINIAQDAKMASTAFGRPASLSTAESKNLQMLRMKTQQEINFNKQVKSDRVKFKKNSKRQNDAEQAILNRLQCLNMEKDLLMKQLKIQQMIDSNVDIIEQTGRGSNNQQSQRFVRTTKAKHSGKITNQIKENHIGVNSVQGTKRRSHLADIGNKRRPWQQNNLKVLNEVQNHANRCLNLASQQQQQQHTLKTFNNDTKTVKKQLCSPIPTSIYMKSGSSKVTSKESSAAHPQSSKKQQEIDLNCLVKKEKKLEDDFSTIQNRFLKYQHDQKLRSKRNSKIMPKNRQSTVRKQQQSRSRSRHATNDNERSQMKPKQPPTNLPLQMAQPRVSVMPQYKSVLKRGKSSTINNGLRHAIQSQQRHHHHNNNVGRVSKLTQEKFETEGTNDIQSEKGRFINKKVFSSAAPSKRKVHKHQSRGASRSNNNLNEEKQQPLISSASVHSSLYRGEQNQQFMVSSNQDLNPYLDGPQQNSCQQQQSQSPPEQKQIDYMQVKLNEKIQGLQISMADSQLFENGGRQNQGGLQQQQQNSENLCTNEGLTSPNNIYNQPYAPVSLQSEEQVDFMRTSNFVQSDNRNYNDENEKELVAIAYSDKIASQTLSPAGIYEPQLQTRSQAPAQNFATITNLNQNYCQSFEATFDNPARRNQVNNLASTVSIPQQAFDLQAEDIRFNIRSSINEPINSVGGGGQKLNDELSYKTGCSASHQFTKGQSVVHSSRAFFTIDNNQKLGTYRKFDRFVNNVIRESTLRRSKRPISIKCSVENFDQRAEVIQSTEDLGEKPLKSGQSIISNNSHQRSMMAMQPKINNRNNNYNNTKSLNRNKAKSCVNIYQNKRDGNHAVRNKQLKQSWQQQSRPNTLKGDRQPENQQLDVKKILAMTPSLCYNTITHQNKQKNGCSKRRDLNSDFLFTKTAGSNSNHNSRMPPTLNRDRPVANNKAMQSYKNSLNEKSSAASAPDDVVEQQSSTLELRKPRLKDPSPIGRLSISTQEMQQKNVACCARKDKGMMVSHRSRNQSISPNSLPKLAMTNQSYMSSNQMIPSYAAANEFIVNSTGQECVPKTNETPMEQLKMVRSKTTSNACNNLTRNPRQVLQGYSNQSPKKQYRSPSYEKQLSQKNLQFFDTFSMRDNSALNNQQQSGNGNINGCGGGSAGGQHRYKKPFIAMKSTKKLTIPQETRLITQERSGRKQRVRPKNYEFQESKSFYE